MATSEKKATQQKKKPHESKEMKRIKRLIKFMDENKQPMAHGLYDKLVFMDNSLQELQDNVEENGALDLFEQGKQSMMRESPALTAYNKTIQRYNQTMKQFTDLLPVSNTKQDKDKLMDFIEGN